MAITTTLYYPADVLPRPLKDGFGMKPEIPGKNHRARNGGVKEYGVAIPLFLRKQM